MVKDLDDFHNKHHHEESIDTLNGLFTIECALFTLICIVDISLNSTLEYGHFSTDGEMITSNVIITIVQVILQVLGFVDLFALLGATFLFRSGLFSLLYKQFRHALLAHPVYIVLTIVLGALRINELSSGTKLIDVWDFEWYMALSIVHKLAALYYYFCTIQAMEKLRDPRYYSQEHWIHRS